MTDPRKAVCQLKKWKEGLKFGADPILRRNVAIFMTRNVIWDESVSIELCYCHASRHHSVEQIVQARACRRKQMRVAGEDKDRNG